MAERRAQGGNATTGDDNGDGSTGKRPRKRAAKAKANGKKKSK